MSKPRVGIIDYKMCNLYSVAHACRAVEMEPIISSDWRTLQECDGLILPGVGAFGDAIKNLKELELDKLVFETVAANKPFMGICLGFQLLFEESEEFGSSEGLGIVKGRVKRFPAEFQGHRLKVPQIGWNRIQKIRESNLLNDIPSGEFVYFIHSYYAEVDDPSWILTKTSYKGFEYCSAIEKNNVFGNQFHPEKSSKMGLKIYENFGTLLQKEKV